MSEQHPTTITQVENLFGRTVERASDLGITELPDDALLIFDGEQTGNSECYLLIELGTDPRYWKGF